MEHFFICISIAVYISQIAVLVLGCMYEAIEKKSTIIFLAIPYGFIGWIIKYYMELEG